MSLRPVPMVVLLASLAACVSGTATAAGSPQFGRLQSVVKSEVIGRPVAAAGPGGALTFALDPELHEGMIRGTWRPGSPLVHPPFAGNHSVAQIRIASSPRGVIALAWVERTNDDRDRIRVAVKAPGHGFGQARTLAVVSDPGDPTIQVGVADDRTVAVAWTNGPDFEETRAHIAVRWPGHAFTSPLRLTRPGREMPPAAPQIAVSRGGHVLAAWVDGERFTPAAALRSARVAGGRLVQKRKISAGVKQVAEEFRLVANPAGKVALGWAAELRGGRRVAQLAVGTTRSGLGRSRSLSRGRGGRGPVPAVGPHGEIAVAWFEPGRLGHRTLVAANSRGGGHLTAAQELGVGNIVLPQLAVDASGRSSVLWIERGGHSVVRTAAAQRHGPFGPAKVVLRTRRGISRPELRASGNRTAVIVIEDGPRSGHDRLWSSLREGALGFGDAKVAVRTVFADIGFTHPGLVPFGNGGFIAVVRYSGNDGLDEQLRASVLRP